MAEIKNIYEINLETSTTISPIVFLLTAKDHQSLKDLTSKYLSFIQSTHSNLLDICYSLLISNNFFPHKLIVNCRSKEELCFLLEKFISGNSKLKTNDLLCINDNLSSDPKIAYVFSGQGGQWFAMGRNLMANQPVFRNSIKEIDLLLKDIAGWSLIMEMDKNKYDSLINKTDISQVAIFAIQVSVVKLLGYYGIKPQGVVGHSLGEVAASYIAGAFSLKEAVYLTYHRGRIQAKQANSGKMLAVQVGVEEAKKDIVGYGNKVSIATINGPNILTISGDTESLIQLAELYSQKGYFKRFVNVEVPYHSSYMDILQPELVEYLGNISLKPATIPLYSSVSAKQEDGLHLTGDYWFKNIRQPVLFTDTINVMIEDGFNVFIEIGPHPLLVEGICSLFEAKSYNGISLSLMNRKFEYEANYFIQGLARLVANNVRVDIEKLLKIPR